MLGLNGAHGAAHAATLQSRPPSCLSPCSHRHPEGFLLVALRCHCGERSAGGQGCLILVPIPVPVPG